MLQKINLRTINGVHKSDGMITLKVKILNIEKNIDVFIIDKKNFKHDFLIGLDCIKKFKLIQNEKLEIEQKTDDPKEKQERYQINFNEHVNQDSFEILTNHLNHQKKNNNNRKSYRKI